MGELTDTTLPSYINGSLVTAQRSAAVKAPLFLAHGLSDDNVHPLTLQPQRRFTLQPQRRFTLQPQRRFT